MTLTPFWHRRVCEATVLTDAIIVALFAWVNVGGINQLDGAFNVTFMTTSLALTSAALAGASYFWASEKYRTNTALVAYIVSLSAVITLIMQTGGAASPFLALWMIGSIFSGVFGTILLSLLTGGIVGTFAVLIITNTLTAHITFSLLLAGLLPLLMSYVLWHGKSSSEKTKERAYYDLANELNQVSNKAEVVIDAISDGVIAINNSGQIELINPAAQRIVGWDHQDALNLDYKSVLQLLSKDGHELDKSTDPVFDVLATNQPKRNSDLQLQTSSGKKIEVEVVVSPIGRMGSGAIIVFRDITKENAEERAQAEFISTASHEMRTPVASIEGYLGLALNPATAQIDEKARDFIGKAHESAQHLGRLFQDLLDITKADDGRLSNNPKVVDIISFTRDVVESLHSKAEEKKLRLFFKPADPSAEGGVRNVEPVFYADLDSDHLREVLANLIENAIKYTLSGEVIVDVQGNEEHIVVSIKDSGIGIPAEDIPHLFQKFYRVDNTDTREIGGTGLGLYLCRKLVEAMGGRIWVDSEYKKGSTFSVEVPRISHEEASRLIEAGAQETIKPSETMNYVGDDSARNDSGEAASGDAMSAKERAQALQTPIILSRKAPAQAQQQPTAAPQPASVPQPVAATTAPTEQADPLMGSPAAAAPAEPLRTPSPMVVPASWQAAPSNVQKAPVPQPAPQTVTQPVQPTATPGAPAARPLAVPKR